MLRRQSPLEASKSWLSGIHVDAFCVYPRWMTEGFVPLPRYDLMPQMGEKIFYCPSATV
ncbi:MAG: hypothetical protein FD135_1429 [Comamonadaceae bacterium]|nr:MAG: hypothetical protein FD135_1429 [Comamonadaceae bacterium]